MRQDHHVVPLAQVVPEVAIMSRAAIKYERMPGVLIQQQSHSSGLPSFKQYKVAPLPEGKLPKRFTGDMRGWQPGEGALDAAPMMLLAAEESDTCERVVLNWWGCGNLRNLKLNFTDPNGNVHMRQHRPMAFGSQCCCPNTSTINKVEAGIETATMGKVVQDCGSPVRVFQQCCLSTTFEEVQEFDLGSSTFQKLYTLRVNQSCCGGTSNNYCGGTPCLPDMVFDVLDEKGRVVATIQRTYGGDGDGDGALCTCAVDSSNYLVSFPDNATNDQRALLLAAVHHVDYRLFERNCGH